MTLRTCGEICLSSYHANATRAPTATTTISKRDVAAFRNPLSMKLCFSHTSDRFYFGWEERTAIFPCGTRKSGGHPGVSMTSLREETRRAKMWGEVQKTPDRFRPCRHERDPGTPRDPLVLPGCVYAA